MLLTMCTNHISLHFWLDHFCTTRGNSMIGDDEDNRTGEEIVKEILEEIAQQQTDAMGEKKATMLRAKMDKFATSMQEYACDNLLNNFTTEELLLIHKWFGDRFVYQVWQDVDWILSKPVISDTIH